MAARDPSHYHAPRPTPVVHGYPPPRGAPPPASRPFGISPVPSSLYEFKQGEGVDVDCRMLTRTPSPTPSEAEALSSKTRSCDIKKYLKPEFSKSPRNIFTLIVTLVIIGGLIAFVVLEQQILDALSPAADWLRE
ncbi:hypothetical protein C8T65DRAFT_700469 [Cerioporus squamosus]|nr:hypothetical protein C8T65DRAFT_700469 [Cerioporus squamosus]